MLSPHKISFLELTLTPNLGPVKIRRLLDKFILPENIFKAGPAELSAVEGITPDIARNIRERKGRGLLDGQLKSIKKLGINIVTPPDNGYPENLKNIYDAPIALFMKGEIIPDDYFSVAIVGTRMCSFYGREMSEKISGELACKGITIVSGGARGIDTSAHRAALRAGGRTICVLGTGLDVPYPLENEKLFEEVAQNGAVITEFPLGTQPRRENFPVRNRIVSGLSLGVAIIEAPQKSGALITARMAAEQGREVFSVPGESGKFNSYGSNQLLRDGAKLVENAGDILEELAPQLRYRLNEINSSQVRRQENTPDSRHCWELTKDENRIYDLLSDAPTHIEEIAAKAVLPIGAVLNILTQLELKKIIKQLPGKEFVRAG